MHIKTIKGKKYYYESKRIGKKVTSVYIGPVKTEGHASRKLEDDSEEISAQSDDEEFYVG